MEKKKNEIWNNFGMTQFQFYYICKSLFVLFCFVVFFFVYPIENRKKKKNFCFLCVWYVDKVGCTFKYNHATIRRRRRRRRVLTIQKVNKCMEFRNQYFKSKRDNTNDCFRKAYWIKRERRKSNRTNEKREKNNN